VQFGVMVVISDAGKAFTADLADEGFFTRVRPLVDAEVTQLQKSLVADLAAHRVLALMSGLMDL